MNRAPYQAWMREELPPFVDLIEQRSGKDMQFYARNYQGVHVPITTMGPADVRNAWLGIRFYEAAS